MDCFKMSNAQAKEFAASCFDVIIEDIKDANDLKDAANTTVTDEKYLRTT